jgi:hypothetical protein
MIHEADPRVTARRLRVDAHFVEREPPEVGRKFVVGQARIADGSGRLRVLPSDSRAFDHRQVVLRGTKRAKSSRIGVAPLQELGIALLGAHVAPAIGVRARFLFIQAFREVVARRLDGLAGAVVCAVLAGSFAATNLVGELDRLRDLLRLGGNERWGLALAGSFGIGHSNDDATRVAGRIQRELDR